MMCAGDAIKAGSIDSNYTTSRSCRSELASLPDEEVSDFLCSSTSLASSIIHYGPLPGSGLVLAFAPTPSPASI